jgi:hypothetical protein
VIVGNASATVCGAIISMLYLFRKNRKRNRELGIVDLMAARESNFKDQMGYAGMENENFRYSF